MTDREQELIEKGRKAEARERAELIDNAYRARAIPGYTDADVGHMTTPEILNLYKNKLKSLGYQT